MGKLGMRVRSVSEVHRLSVRDVLFLSSPLSSCCTCNVAGRGCRQDAGVTVLDDLQTAWRIPMKVKRVTHRGSRSVESPQAPPSSGDASLLAC